MAKEIAERKTMTVIRTYTLCKYQTNRYIPGMGGVEQYIMQVVLIINPLQQLPVNRNTLYSAIKYQADNDCLLLDIPNFLHTSIHIGSITMGKNFII